ncbi:hypothetical protein RJT34_15489 [Clitoria ternatea]|uniref:S-protein homolog n=1 Tax=Clitoria ternatea TaxID=43366 RepID=A0AAN9PBG9_CLITE
MGEVQIILMLVLILSCQVSNADWLCLGARAFTITIENRLSEDFPEASGLFLDCTRDKAWFEGIYGVSMWLTHSTSFKLCTGYFRVKYYDCHVSLGIWQHDFRVLDKSTDCGKDMHCRWQIRRDHALFFNYTLNQFVEREYSK